MNLQCLTHEMQSKYADRKSESLSSSGVGSDEVNFSANNTGKTQVHYTG